MMEISVIVEPLNLNTLAATIKNFKINIPRALMKGLLHLRELIEATVLKITRDFLMQKNIRAEIADIQLQIDKSNDTINGITVKVESVNYQQVITALLPDIVNSLNNALNAEPIIKILDVIGDDRDEIICGALSPLDNARIEEIIKILVFAYQKELCTNANRALSEKQIPVRISKIDVY